MRHIIRRQRRFLFHAFDFLVKSKNGIESAMARRSGSSLAGRQKPIAITLSAVDIDRGNNYKRYQAV